MKKTAKRKKKKSLMPGMRQALKEVRAHLLGIKKLPGAGEKMPTKPDK
jgi:hypothetical protein